MMPRSVRPSPAGWGELSRMKAEERKALETNALANSLGNFLQKAKEGISRNTLIIVGVLVVVVLLVYTWRFFAARSRALNAELWLKWDNMGDPEELERVLRELKEKDKDLTFDPSARKELVEITRLDEFTKKHAGTTQARLARFLLARLTLHNGLRDLGNLGMRDRALKNLEKAAEVYGQLVTETRDLPLLYQEALLNSGKANESLGKIDKATNYYTKLKSEYPTTAFGLTAKKELERLESNKTEVAKLVDDLVVDKSAPPKPLEVPK